MSARLTKSSTGDFPKLKLPQYPAVQDRETSEAKYWKAFQHLNPKAKFNCQGTPSCIHFNPANEKQYIVTASSKVSLYFCTPFDKLQRSYSRFQDDAFSGKFRRDGKLIVAGDRTGSVKVFDVETKALLRQLKRHSAAVRSTAWSSDGLFMLSASDDKNVKRWDLGTQDVVWDSKKVHHDYVRALDSHPTVSHIFVTGSYDHSICLWDSRVQGPVHTMNHGHPVEYCMIAPTGAMMMTAGGNEVKVWDLFGSNRLMHTFSNHQKNVTGIAMDGSGSRLLSCSLDGHVKVYSLHTMQVVNGMHYGAPLVSMGISADNKKLVVGYADGTLSIKTRKDGSTGSLGLEEDDKISSNSKGSFTSHDDPTSMSRQERFYKGAGAAAERIEDGLVETERTIGLRPYEKHLKLFNYQLALDTALKSRNPLVVVTVLEELCRRSGLTIALTGRDENSLEPILSFAAKYISNPRYSKLIVQVTHKLLDMYSSVIGHSDAIDELFLKLAKQVKTEVTFQRQVMKCMGALDGIISASTMPSNYGQVGIGSDL